MPRGGKRIGAGRPKNSGKWGNATKAIRVPLDLVEKIENFVICQGYSLPLYDTKVPAGFPSPADDDLASKLDLNQYLIKHPAATFFVRVIGDSMIGAGINDGDILIVDRSIEALNGKIVIAALNGELTVKRLKINSEAQYLMPENDKYQPIPLNDNDEITIWGVVTNVIHQL